MIAQCPLPPPKQKLCQYQKKTPEIKLNLSRCAPFHTKTRAGPRYPMSHCSPHQARNPVEGPHYTPLKIQKVPRPCKKSHIASIAGLNRALNALLRVSRRKISKIFPCDNLFSCNFDETFIEMP